MSEASKFIRKDGSIITFKDSTARNDIQTLSETKVSKPAVTGNAGQALIINNTGEIVWGTPSSGDSGGSAYIAENAESGEVILSPASLEFNDYQAQTVQITDTTGSVEIDSYNSNNVDASMNNEGLITVSPVNGGFTESKSGSIDLYVKSNSGYTPGIASIPYIIKYNVPYVKWGEATVEQIQQLFQLDAAGTIKLDEYWQLGDERVIHLNAIPQYKNANNQIIVDDVPETDLIFVLLHKGLYLDENENEVHYVIGAKNMPNAQAMVHGDSNVNNFPGWFDSDLNVYLQNYFYPALDDNDKALFKNFICKANRNTTNNKSTNTMDTRIQKITLPSIVELYGKDSSNISSYVSDIENEQLDQFDWYAQNVSNKNKYIGSGTSSNYYKTRSQYATSNYYYMDNTGASLTYSAFYSKQYYIAPQLCI